MFETVLDANVLLNFLAGNALEVMAKFFDGKAYVAPHVRRVELAKGVAKGRPDPCVLNGADWVQVVDDLDTDEYQTADDLVLRLGKEQHRGEAESIAICLHRGHKFASQDIGALRIAIHRGVAVVTTTRILNDVLRHGHCSRAQVLAIATQIQERDTTVDPRDIVDFGAAK